MSPPNPRVLDALNEAYREWDLEALHRVLADDVVYHIPGRSPVAGDYRGRDAVLDLWARQKVYMDGRFFAVEFIDTLVSEDHVVAVTAGEGRAGDQVVATRGANIYRIVDDRIVECWPLYGDMAAFDEFWAHFNA
jgi:ketosteroid isomerase-like protein